jgi:hypothetical protein
MLRVPILEIAPLPRDRGRSRREAGLVELCAASAEGAPVDAVTAFERALRLARESAAHTCSSCAPPSTSRGGRRHRGQPVEARKRLAPVYGLFTEAAAAADVQEARAVLAGLDG